MDDRTQLSISVFGLGYVGAVTAACLVRDGHRVVGVDVNPDKVALLRAGKPPIVERGLDELLAAAAQSGRLSATTSATDAVEQTDVSMISVGTPPLPTGATDLGFVFRVCEEIAAAVAAKGRPHVVVLRSTVPPGTLGRVAEVFKAAGVADAVHLAFNPEFLREGSAIADYDGPPYTVIGTTDAKAEDAVRRMYAPVDAPVHVVAPGTAEMVKFVANAWHAAKITFANEIGRVAKGFGLDGSEVMDLIIRDTKLNVSPAYMKPGGPFGGSCLPKDLRAIVACARERTIPVPVLEAIQTSNQVQVDLWVAQVLALRRRSVAVFGLAFKPGTDDLRESPAVPLVKRLLGEGFNIRIFDPHVHQATLMGTNLAYIREHLPHFESLMAPTANEAAASAEALVITQTDRTLRGTVEAIANGRPVLDLAR